MNNGEKRWDRDTCGKMRLRIKSYMGKARRHQDPRAAIPVPCPTGGEEGIGSDAPQLLMLCSSVATCLLFSHPPTASSSLLGKASQRYHIIFWVQSKPVHGSRPPRQNRHAGMGNGRVWA